jgi:hypothetical protein
MNVVIMARERLLFRSSPDKGRTGGVCSDKIGFLRDLPLQTPLNPPLSGGKWTKQALQPHPTAALCNGPENPMAFMQVIYTAFSTSLHSVPRILSLLRLQ